MRFLLENLALFSGQLAIVTLAGGIVAQLLRKADPRTRLAHWRLVLLVGFLFPFLGHWETPAGDAVSITVGMARAWNTPTAPVATPVPWDRILAGILVSGSILFLARLGLGALRIRLYRLRSRPLAGFPAEADFRVSVEINSPVTFGWLHPVVLLPESFLELPAGEQRSVVAHELAHVRRRDWLHTVCEEVLRAVVWFHPAVWFVLHRIQVEREQVVDLEAIRETGDRDAYLQALLTVAGVKSRVDFVPAPLFLRKRQLAQRVATILKEVNPMNVRKKLIALTASAAALTLAAGMISTVLPMKARAQETRAGRSDTTLKSGLRVLHKVNPEYPPIAKVKRIEGTVNLELNIDARGLVTDARVLSGPEELRRAAQQAVLQWQFEPSGFATRAEVEINFSLVKDTGERRMLGVVRGVEFEGVPADVQNRVRPRLLVKEGETLYEDAVKEIRREIAEVDPKLQVSFSEDQVLRISPAPVAIRVGGNVQSTKLVKKVPVVYPALAKQAKIQGTVRMNVTIAADGTVKNLVLVSGHPLLVPAALESVKQWEYAPTLLNGKPAEVVTVVDINFTLQDEPPPAV